MATATSTPIERLYQRLSGAGTIQALRLLLTDIKAIERALQGDSSLETLREEVFAGLLRLVRDQPDQARDILLGDLLPLCLRAKEERPGDGDRGRYGEILRRWIDEFPGSVRAKLLNAVFPVVVQAMKDHRVRPACATVWALCHRTDDVVEALAEIASARDDEIGDLALSVRVHLGVPRTDREGLLTDLHRRAERRWNHSLVSSLTELADRASIDLVFRRLDGGGLSPDDQAVLPYFAAQITAAICEHHFDDEALQDDVWKRLTSGATDGRIRSALIMNGQLAGRVDSPHVLSTYLNLLEGDPAPRGDVIYYRTEELARPRQLLGWELEPGARALEVILRDAQSASAMQSVWSTLESRRKLLAWETLFSLGRTDLSQLVVSAIGSETNGYALGQMFEIASCLAMDPLPACVPDLIAARFTHVTDKEDQRMIAHIGAIGVAHSAQSEEAFRALLNYEKVKESGVLLSLINALADCADALTGSDRLDAEAVLFQSTEGDQPQHLRSAAAAALAKLIRRGRLRRPSVEKILALLRDDSLDVFARRELIDASGHTGGSPPDPELVTLLSTIAGKGPTADAPAVGAENAPGLRQVALGALARLGVLASNGNFSVNYSA